MSLVGKVCLLNGLEELDLVCMCVFVGACVCHGACVKPGGGLVGVGPLVLPYGSRELI